MKLTHLIRNEFRNANYACVHEMKWIREIKQINLISKLRVLTELCNRKHFEESNTQFKFEDNNRSG